MINFCKTRWVQRINGISVFLNCYVVTYKCLKKISDYKPFNGSTWNAESSATACRLYDHMERLPFIIALRICKEILSYTKLLTKSLQGWLCPCKKLFTFTPEVFLDKKMKICLVLSQPPVLSLYFKCWFKYYKKSVYLEF